MKNNIQATVWKRAATVATGSLALVFAGCGDRDDQYTATDEQGPAYGAVTDEQRATDQPVGGVTDSQFRDAPESTTGSDSTGVAAGQQQPYGAGAQPGVSQQDAGQAPQYGQTGAERSGVQDYGQTGQAPEEVARTGQAQQDDNALAQSEYQEPPGMADSEDIESLVMNELRNGDLQLTDEEIARIDIRVEDDTVILNGTAPSEEAIWQIERAIARLKQVAEVENNLSS